MIVGLGHGLPNPSGELIASPGNLLQIFVVATLFLIFKRDADVPVLPYGTSDLLNFVFWGLLLFTALVLIDHYPTSRSEDRKPTF